MCHIIPHDCIKKESKYSEKHIQNVHFWICVISLWWHHIHHVFLKNILKFGSKMTKWFWNISVKYIGKNANQIFFGRVSQSGASNYFGLVGWEMQLPGWLFHSSFFAFHYDFLFISIYCSHKPNQVTHTHSAEWLRYDKLHTEDDDPHTSYLVTLFKASDSGDVSKRTRAECIICPVAFGHFLEPEAAWLLFYGTCIPESEWQRMTDLPEGRGWGRTRWGNVCVCAVERARSEQR